MDSQGTGIRKIALKHRLLGLRGDTQGPSTASSQGEAHFSEAIDEIRSDDGENTLHYQGEIFDQFYRPLSALGGGVRLAELAEEGVTFPQEKAKLSKCEAEAQGRLQQQAAEALANQIYNLAQVERESDVDVYLSAFNVVLANRNCYEAMDILSRANHYFTERYYNEIRERGERPEIVSQIVKRVGHAVSDRIGRIASGVDVRQMAAELWNTFHGPLPHRMALVEDRLLDCTERQARALRSEFLAVPFRDIARQLREVMSTPASTADTSVTAKRPATRNEVYDAKRQQALFSRDRLRAVRYLLFGRSEEEVGVIKQYFIELDESDQSEDDSRLEAELSRLLSPTEFEKIKPLLTGWSPEREAEEIHSLLYPAGNSPEIEDTLSDPRDAVDRDFGEGIGPFLRRFKKRRMWLGKTDVKSRVQNVYEVLAERIAALSIERFLQTNEELVARYGYELDLTWFPSGSLFDPRALAAVLYERICVAYNFFELVKPLEFLGPQECIAVQKAYASLCGIELKDAIDNRLNQLRDKTPQAEREMLYARYVDGRGRWPLSVDLLARYRGEEAEINEWSPEFVPTGEDEQRAIRLAQEVDNDVPKGAIDAVVGTMLAPLSQQELRRLERTFLEMTDPPIPLSRALSEVLSAEAFNRYHVAIFGLDLDECADRIASDPLTLEELRNLPVSVIKIIRNHFQLKYNQKLDLFVMGQYSLEQDEDIAVSLLSIVYTPEAYLFRPAIQEFRKEIPAHLDGLRRFWSRDFLGRMGMERAIDIHFPRFRVLVKQAAARHALLPATLAEIILGFEEISSDITARILECIDVVDIERLLSILRTTIHNQRTVEEVYDLLYPDAQLRDSIKAMPVDLDLINETLLHLDGFSAQAVAEEIHELGSFLTGAGFGEELLRVLTPSNEDHRNPRIPNDVNWQDEMMYQIALAYERLYGVDLFDDCQRRGVPLDYVEQITGFIFGFDVCASARELHELIRTGKEGRPLADGAEERVASFLESRGARHRERAVRAYAAFWARQPGSHGLVDDLTRFLRESSFKRKILAIVASVGQR
jgi:hypothetical protein